MLRKNLENGTLSGQLLRQKSHIKALQHANRTSMVARKFMMKFVTY